MIEVSGSSQAISWRSLAITVWVTERLPAVRMVITRSPEASNTNILRKQAILSKPALVRVSDSMTMPASSSRPTQ